MEWYLPAIWAALIGVAVAMYVLLDGFDLGCGILFPTTRSESERDQITRSIAPFWLPIILGYVIFIYWLFRGKIREGYSH